MQIFYINQGSTLPYLRMELIDDARYDFLKSYQFNNAIQNADVTFTMYDMNGNLKIQKSPATIYLSDEECCEERYIIQYEWKKRDTKEKGEFIGKFEFTFKGELKEEGKTYESGNLIFPIVEELVIFVK